MPLEPFKYIVQCVAIERDEQGNVVREVPAEAQNAYQTEHINEIIRKFQEEIARLNRQSPQSSEGSENGSRDSDGHQDYVRQSEVSGPPGLGR